MLRLELRKSQELNQGVRPINWEQWRISRKDHNLFFSSMFLRAKFKVLNTAYIICLIGFIYSCMQFDVVTLLTLKSLFLISLWPLNMIFNWSQVSCLRPQPFETYFGLKTVLVTVADYWMETYIMEVKEVNFEQKVSSQERS